MGEPGDFDIAAIDATWVRRRSPDHFEVDLSRSSYVSHASLLYLVAFARRRHVRDQPTRFKLPTSERAIDYLRAWKFPEAIELACETRFVDLIDAKSRARLAAMPERSRYEIVVVTPEGGRETMLPVHYFALTPIRISDPYTPDALKTSPERAATTERDRWLAVHLRALLDHYLGGFGDTVATRIVYEAVLNAASHSGARMGLASAQILKHRDGDDKGKPIALEIAIWDDGDTFIQTLQAQLDDEKPITSIAYGRFDEHFTINLTTPDGPMPKIELDSRTTENETSPPALLISAFMLGITSSPDRPPTVDDFGRIRHKDPGLGLYYVRRAAIDKFGGEIEYYAAQFHASIAAGEEKWHYEANVDYSPTGRAPIAGNLLIVRFPLDEPATPPELDET